MRVRFGDRADTRLRFLDRYAGIPLVLFLGLKPKESDLPAFSVLGLLQTAAIGDTVLMAGVLPDLRRSFPEARIILFSGSSNYSMARMLPGVDDVIQLPIHNPVAMVQLLRSKRVDVLCDFGPWPRINAVCSTLSGARFLIGFRTPGQHRHYVYDYVVEHSPRLHELENQRALVRALGVESRSFPQISVDTPLPKVLSPKSYIVFHPWSAGYRSSLKEWPDENWLKLGERVVGRLGYQIAITGGPSDRVRAAPFHARLAARTGSRVLNLAGETSLAEMIRVLKDAVAVVSVNTSTVHLAPAVGTPVVSLNGPVKAARWGPLGPKSISINAEGPDCDFISLGFEVGHREDCMATIKPEVVFKALFELLQCVASESGKV